MSWKEIWDWKTNLIGTLIVLPGFLAVYWTQIVLKIPSTWILEVRSYEALWLVIPMLLQSTLIYWIYLKRFDPPIWSVRKISWLNLMKVVIMPVGEEFIFRWYMITLFALAASVFVPIPTAIVIGMIISAILFGCLHYKQGFVSIADAFGGAVILTVIALLGGLPMAILAHCLHNFYAVLTNGPDG